MYDAVLLNMVPQLMDRRCRQCLGRLPSTRLAGFDEDHPLFVTGANEGVRETISAALRSRRRQEVQRFLVHSDPGFTQRTYVHLLDDDLSEPNVLRRVRGGHNVATRPSETQRDQVTLRAAESA
jgi:hypothetical protein